MNNYETLTNQDVARIAYIMGECKKDYEKTREKLSEFFVRKPIEEKDEWVYISDSIEAYNVYSSTGKYFGKIITDDETPVDYVTVMFGDRIFEEDVDYIDNIDRLFSLSYDAMSKIFGEDFLNEYKELKSTHDWKSEIQNAQEGDAFLFLDFVDNASGVFQSLYLYEIESISSIGNIKYRIVDTYGKHIERYGTDTKTTTLDQIVLVKDLIKCTIDQIVEIFDNNSNYYMPVIKYVACMYKFVTGKYKEETIVFTDHGFTTLAQMEKNGYKKMDSSLPIEAKIDPSTLPDPVERKIS